MHIFKLLITNIRAKLQFRRRLYIRFLTPYCFVVANFHKRVAPHFFRIILIIHSPLNLCMKWKPIFYTKPFYIVMKGKKSGRHHREEESSLSSLGPLLETNSVTNQFKEDHASQRRLTMHVAGSASLHRVSARRPTHRPTHRGEHRGEQSKHHHLSRANNFSTIRPEEEIDRACPHCTKKFANGWAVPNHVTVGVRSILFHLLAATIHSDHLTKASTQLQNFLLRSGYTTVQVSSIV